MTAARPLRILRQPHSICFALQTPWIRELDCEISSPQVFISLKQIIGIGHIQLVSNPLSLSLTDPNIAVFRSQESNLEQAMRNKALEDRIPKICC